MESRQDSEIIGGRIKRRLASHLKRLGFRKNGKGELSPPDLSKEALRHLHLSQRSELLKRNASFVSVAWPRLERYFADGSELSIGSIEPRLELVSSHTWQSDLFRLASLSWSVPVTAGYGRRLRFLVWDETIGKLIGLIGLCDPVFNLKARDDYIGWTANERRLRLVHSLSAYILGAVPPYSMLLGSKLVACLVRSREIKEAFSVKYAESTGIISKEKRTPSLVLVTASSALGRSSIYNRLTLGGQLYFRQLGYSGGWGHFHIPESLFVLIREYLSIQGESYAKNYRFGDGPNWRLRAIRRALSLAGVNPNVLRHGVKRELFACELAHNARGFLRGEVKRPSYRGLLKVSDIGALAQQRWIIARATRYPQYLEWQREEFYKLVKALPRLGD